MWLELQTGRAWNGPLYPFTPPYLPRALLYCSCHRCRGNRSRRWSGLSWPWTIQPIYRSGKRYEKAAATTGQQYCSAPMATRGLGHLGLGVGTMHGNLCRPFNAHFPCGPVVQIKLAWKAHLPPGDRFLATSGAGLVGIFLLWRVPSAIGFMTRNFLHHPLNRETAATAATACGGLVVLLLFRPFT